MSSGRVEDVRLRAPAARKEKWMKRFYSTVLMLLLFVALSRPSAVAQSGAGGILDHVLLDYIDYNYRNKRVHVEQARAMNLSADNSDVKVTMKIKSADGTTLGVYESNALAPKRNKSYWMQGFSAAGGTPQMLDLPGAGDYLLEFSANGKVFDQFPFSLAPYSGAGGESWFVMDGLWNDHAMIDTSKEFVLSIWMRDMLEGTGQRASSYGKYSARIVREKDGKVIGVTPSNTENQTLAPMRKWTRYNITFVRDKTEAPVGIYDITAQDGPYFIELTHDGKLYGKYPFTVRGGKLQGVTEFRGTQLETGGGDFTWLKRAGAK
jgi:hypothetical protein